MKTRGLYPCQPSSFLSILALSIGLFGSSSAMAETEVEALRRELAEQKEVIRQILAAQQAQKEVSAKVEAKVDAQAKAAAETPTNGTAAQAVASALQNVTIYGVLDGGFEHITNIGSGHSTVTRMPAITGSIPSRVGIRAAKEFAPGYKAIATAEMGINLDDGTHGQGNRLFGRQLFGGVDTPYGAFTIGRQYSMLMYALGDADLLGPMIYSMGSLDAYLPNARFDNSAAWRGTFSNVSLGVTYSTGRDTSGGTPASGTCAGEIAGRASACKGWSAMAKYDNARFGIAAGFDEQRGGTGATASFFNGSAPIAFTRPQDFDRRITASANLKLGPAKLGAGWLGREVNVLSGSYKSNIWFLDAAYKLNSRVSFDGGLYRITNHDQDRDATLVALRAFYNLDKDFDTYVQLGHITNSELAANAVSVGAGVAPPAGGSQTGAMLGLRYRF